MTANRTARATWARAISYRRVRQPTEGGVMRCPEHDESFVRFVRECGSQLYRVAYLLTGQTATAEDLYQAALTRSYTAWRRVREEDAYRYVRRVLVNLHTDWWRAPRTWRERTVSA